MASAFSQASNMHVNLWVALHSLVSNQPFMQMNWVSLLWLMGMKVQILNNLEGGIFQIILISQWIEPRMYLIIVNLMALMKQIQGRSGALTSIEPIFNSNSFILTTRIKYKINSHFLLNYY